MGDSLIFDWNKVREITKAPPHRIEFDDETLRDGLQSPSVRNPPVEAKVRILHLMDGLGIDIADIGLPAAGTNAADDVERLAREIVNAKLKIRPACAARTHPQDIQPIIDISERVGIPIEVHTFIGSSPIRLYAEDWTLDYLLQATEDSITFAIKHGLPVMYVTEDTTRSGPKTIRKLYTTAINCGAKRVCVCDTVGHATPDGVRALIAYVREVVAETGEDVKIDWHGHSDRGLGGINAITAAASGAHRLHGTALAIGERVGNVHMDLLMVNLQLMGWIDRDLSLLKEYCETVSEACRVPIPHNYPVIGRDAFRTATGVHAAAVIKAYKKRDHELANAVYSGVPAQLFGLEQQIEIGYMSGRSNVIYWLEKRHIVPTDELVERILCHAKNCSSVLSEADVFSLVMEGVQA
jgi:2-isopropylmalate synthase